MPVPIPIVGRRPRVAPPVRASAPGITVAHRCGHTLADVEEHEIVASGRARMPLPRRRQRRAPGSPGRRSLAPRGVRARRVPPWARVRHARWKGRRRHASRPASENLQACVKIRHPRRRRDDGPPHDAVLSNEIVTRVPGGPRPGRACGVGGACAASWQAEPQARVLFWATRDSWSFMPARFGDRMVSGPCRVGDEDGHASPARAN